MLEVTLQPGDVLYVPRGVVHQAAAEEAGSCHLTVSTYQHWTVGNLLGEVIKVRRRRAGRREERGLEGAGGKGA